MAGTVQATVSIACNSVLASYKAIQAFLDIAIKAPVTILKLIEAQVDIAKKFLSNNVSGITKSMVSLTNSVSDYLSAVDLDIDTIRAAFMCPLITTFLTEEQLEEYTQWVEDYITGAASDINKSRQQFSNNMYSSLMKNKTFLTDQMNTLLDEEVYARINSWINVVEQSYWADLGNIHPSLKGESIMSLLGYLTMGEQCIKAFCDGIVKVGLQEVADYLSLLNLKKIGEGVYKYEPYTDMPNDIVQSCVDAGQETQDALDHMSDTFDSFGEGIEPIDPYSVDSWKAES